MKKHIKLRKQGKFYSAFEEDAFVIHSILGYKIVNGRIGFPENSLGKVTNELNNYKVDYVVIVKDEEVEKKHFPNNNYNKYLKDGINRHQKNLDEEQIISKIKSLPSEKIEKIYKYIEEVINE